MSRARIRGVTSGASKPELGIGVTFAEPMTDCKYINARGRRGFSSCLIRIIPHTGTMRTTTQASKLLFRQHAAFSVSCGRRGLASLTRQPQPTRPCIVRPSEAELRDKSLGARNLELAVRSLHADGLVVVEDAIPHKDLDALNEKMVKDARYLQSLGDKGPFNYNQGNLQQDPPPVAEYFYKSIFTSRFTPCPHGRGSTDIDKGRQTPSQPKSHRQSSAPAQNGPSAPQIQPCRLTPLPHRSGSPSTQTPTLITLRIPSRWSSTSPS